MKRTCGYCGHKGRPKRQFSWIIFIILIFLGFFPAIIYYAVCPQVCRKCKVRV